MSLSGITGCVKAHSYVNNKTLQQLTLDLLSRSSDCYLEENTNIFKCTHHLRAQEFSMNGNQSFILASKLRLLIDESIQKSINNAYREFPICDTQTKNEMHLYKYINIFFKFDC